MFKNQYIDYFIAEPYSLLMSQSDVYKLDGISYINLEPGSRLLCKNAISSLGKKSWFILILFIKLVNLYRLLIRRPIEDLNNLPY